MELQSRIVKLKIENDFVYVDNFFGQVCAYNFLITFPFKVIKIISVKSALKVTQKGKGLEPKISATFSVK